MIIKDQTCLITMIKQGKLGIIPTDTIYGFSCAWNANSSLERLFQIKKRSLNQPFLILIASFFQLQQFIDVDQKIVQYFKSLTTPVTVVFPLKPGFSSPFWTDTVAIRFVKWSWLQTVVLATGPIVSTSCNVSGQIFSNDFQQLLFFQDEVDFIFAKKTQGNTPSSVVDWVSQQQKR